MAAIPLLEILAFNGAVVMFHSSIGAALVAKGHVRDITRVNIYYVLLMLAMLAALVPYYGVVGAAYALLATALAMSPSFLYLIWRRLGVGVGIYARAIVRPLLASALMILAVRLALPDYEESMSMQYAAALLLGGVVLGTAVYASAVALLWALMGRPAGVEHKLFERIRRLVWATSG
jgi:O-antigen/teichoic acid export membrane protein